MQLRCPRDYNDNILFSKMNFVTYCHQLYILTNFVIYSIKTLRYIGVFLFSIRYVVFVFNKWSKMKRSVSRVIEYRWYFVTENYSCRCCLNSKMFSAHGYLLVVKLQRAKTQIYIRYTRANMLDLLKKLKRQTSIYNILWYIIIGIVHNFYDVI